MAVRAHEFKSLNYVEKANKSTACYLKTLKQGSSCSPHKRARDSRVLRVPPLLSQLIERF